VIDPAGIGRAPARAAAAAPRVRAATAADAAAIDALVLRSPRGTVFHTGAWRRAVERTFPFESLDLVAEAGGELRGFLPLAYVKNPLKRPFLVSIPFAVYGGVVAEGAEAERALLREAERLARERRAEYVEIRSRDPVDYGLPEKDLYVTFVRDLPATPEECLAMIPRKARAATRQAADRHGLSADLDRGAFDEFFDLYVENKRDLGSPPLPKRFLASLMDAFGEQASVLAVRKDGRAVAAVMTLFFRDTVVPYYSGASAAAEPLHPNNFMYFRLQQEGVKRGYKKFDFGRSRRDTGAFDFKRNQGFDPTPLHYQYVLLGGAKMPDVNPGNPKYALAESVFRRLPRPAARAIGAAVSRYFP
jgi:FemAB-related protein (PEP-CTERM system-associated)